MRPHCSRQGGKSVVLCLLAAIVAGCATGGFRPGESVQVDSGLSIDDAAREEQMALVSAQRIEAKTPMWNDPLLEAYLTEVTQRIVVVAKHLPCRIFGLR